MSSSSSLWLITYDIAKPKRLRKVAEALEDHGRRLQQSVFLCEQDAAGLTSLRKRLLGLVDLSADRLALLPICGRCRSDIEQHGTEITLPGTAEAVVV